MTDSAMTKFMKDQSDAVKVALEVRDKPSDYFIRVDAINAALSLHSGLSTDSTMRDVVKDAAIAEAYLKGDSK